MESQNNNNAASPNQIVQGMEPEAEETTAKPNEQQELPSNEQTPRKIKAAKKRSSGIKKSVQKQAWKKGKAANVPPKPKTVFHDEWLTPADPGKQEQQWPRWSEWLAKVPNNSNSFGCRLCKTDVGLGVGGTAYITRHVQAKKHFKAIRELDGQDAAALDGEREAANSGGGSAGGINNRKRTGPIDTPGNNNETDRRADSGATSATSAKRIRPTEDAQLARKNPFEVGAFGLGGAARAQQPMILQGPKTIAIAAARTAQGITATGAGASCGLSHLAPTPPALGVVAVQDQHLPRAPTADVIDLDDEDEVKPTRGDLIGNHASNGWQQSRPIANGVPRIVSVHSGLNYAPVQWVPNIADGPQDSAKIQALTKQLTESKEQTAELKDKYIKAFESSQKLKDQVDEMAIEKAEMASQLEAWQVRCRELEAHLVTIENARNEPTDSKAGLSG